LQKGSRKEKILWGGLQVGTRKKEKNRGDFGSTRKGNCWFCGKGTASKMRSSPDRK